MDDVVIRIRLLVLLVLLSAAGFIWMGVWGQTADATETSFLQVQFLDVGQGDAILIQAPTGEVMLVDGGRDAGVVRQLSQELGWFDRDIDVLVSTHPDLDHIGGLVDVLARYTVGTIVTTENTGESLAAAAYADGVQTEGAAIVFARAGQVIHLGASTTVRVLSPAQNPAQLESNASSIVLQVQYGEIEFMLTGDAPKGIEDYLVTQHGATLESEVLKLGHHGSDTSTSAIFLEAVSPTYGVVSAGKDNRYGHPHPDVVARASAAGARVISTAESGTVSFATDGTSVWQQH